ncbi:MAG: GTPase HflX [Cryomorphaceae bacterium]|nr:GTPase HflX [Cryomorphaceae bacterium]
MLERKKDPKQEKAETAVLIGAQTRNMSDDELAEYLDELEFLAETAGAVTLKRFTQKLTVTHPRTYLGIGKVKEIDDYVKEHKVDLIIFDDELSPSQIKNLEKVFDQKVMDRTNLILDIFAARARTAHSRTQVELAQYQYLLPRLSKMWTHLERQKGGIGMRGPGETQIETDRRIITQKIALLKERLGKIDQQMATQRKSRDRMVRVALVGYTNVGKSTIMNLISKSEVFAENKLFATLDTTVRKVFHEGIKFLLSDTVGFIRKLPTQLVESFKSTLDEVREADLLIHVVDISHPYFEDHIKTVQETLMEISGEEKETLLVFNKIDAFQHAVQDEDDLSPKEKRHMSLQDWKQTWMNRMGDNVVFISAQERINLEEFRKKLHSLIITIRDERYPFSEGYTDYWNIKAPEDE